jgi:hypothetical protein
VANAELAYLRGDFAQVLQLFSKLELPVEQIVVAQWALPAAISQGDWPFYSKVLALVEPATSNDAEPGVFAYGQLILATGHLGGKMMPQWLVDGDLSVLPVPIRFEAARMRADYLAYRSQHAESLLVAETALHLMSAVVPKTHLTGTEIYLRLHCAAACDVLGRTDDAEAWLLSAMELALPNGFFTPFADKVVQLRGLLGPVLKKHYPQYYEPVLALAGRTVPNWVAFRDFTHPKPVARRLSVQDLEILNCVINGMTATEVARRFHLSVGSVHNRMRGIYQKLGIDSSTPRKELPDIWFQPTA